MSQFGTQQGTAQYVCTGCTVGRENEAETKIKSESSIQLCHRVINKKEREGKKTPLDAVRMRHSGIFKTARTCQMGRLSRMYFVFSFSVE